MRCPDCGQENETGNTSCRFCGKQFEDSSVLVTDKEDAANDSDYAVYSEGAPSRGNKTAIIISVIIVLLLLFFAFMIYRRLTRDKRNSSSIFHEESEPEPPLLLPSFKTDPTQAFTIRPKSTTDSNESEATDRAEASSATQASETASAITNVGTTESTTSFSIRVVVNTDLETETVFSEAGDSTETGQDSSTESSDQSSEPSSKTDQAAAVHVHIFPDPSNHPLIRLYYGVDIDKNDEGKALFEFSQLDLRIFERLNKDDEWQEQVSLYKKKNSNISLLVNFGQSFETSGSIKVSLFELLDAMKLNHDLPEKEDTDANNDSKPGKDESEADLPDGWDQLSLISYGSQLLLQTELTPYYYTARDAIWNASRTSGSRLLLHDAIYKAVELTAKSGQGTVVIVTDGSYRNNEKSLDEVLELATEERIPVYIIYLREKESNATADLPDRHSEKTLREFAYKTRGDLFSIDAASEKWQRQLTAALLLALDRDEQDTFLTYKSTFKTAPDTQHYLRLEFTFEEEDTAEEFKFFADSLYNIPVPDDKD